MDARLARWKSRLSDLPSLVLPTDYPRPADPSKLVEATQSSILPEQLSEGIAKLAQYDKFDNINATEPAKIERKFSRPPTPFHILLSAFVILLHRYTCDSDLLIATFSASSKTRQDPLLLRIKLDPNDSFWELVCRIQFLETEAENDAIPYEDLIKSLGREEGMGPLFRVRVFDDSNQERAEKQYIEQTSSTSDMTMYVKTAHEDVTSQTPSNVYPKSRSSVSTIALRLHYNSLLFSHSRMAQVLAQVSLVLSTGVSEPNSPIGSVNLITPEQKAILPDPRADLEFCGWRGAITDIFSANAAKHPDRPCIVESVNPNENRTFSYKMMDQASNILAHALIGGGVKREDVVTVYSTRNVDLVVAVMGILKAGATFSVIGQAVLIE